MQIEIVYAAPEKQTILNLHVAEETTIEDALVKSGIFELYPNVGAGLRAGPSLGEQQYAVGIFGKIRSLDWVLKAGDRLEIYRPLRVDPKVARLERAKKSKNTKKIKTKKRRSAT
jgi:putative ubiquitin-RnfH superfamily antitoxin RatB of RatAB toxin-antitoxin module